MKYLIILLFPSLAHAGWFCQEGSSERSGSVINACGVAQASDENEARTKAFKNAQNEYRMLCDASSDCKGHKVNIKPQRTLCEHTAAGFSCWRMLSFYIDEEMLDHNEDIMASYGGYRL